MKINQTDRLGREGGFTLPELSIVLTLIAIMLSGAVVGIPSYIHAKKQNATEEKFELVLNALSTYSQRHYRLPCPSAPPTPGIPATGLERDGGNCFTYADDATLFANTQGVVPWKELGLTERDVTDGWGRYITYKPAPHLTVNSYSQDMVQGEQVDTYFADVHNACRTQSWFTLGESPINTQKALFCCNSQPKRAYLEETYGDVDGDTYADNLEANTWKRSAITAAGTIDGAAIDDDNENVLVTNAWMDDYSAMAVLDDGDPDTEDDIQSPFYLAGAYNEPYRTAADSTLSRASSNAVTLISHGGNGSFAFKPGAATQLNADLGGTEEQKHTAAPEDFAGNIAHPKSSQVAAANDRPMPVDPSSLINGPSDDMVAFVSTDSLFSRIGSASCIRPASAGVKVNFCPEKTYGNQITFIDNTGSMREEMTNQEFTRFAAAFGVLADNPDTPDQTGVLSNNIIHEGLYDSDAGSPEKLGFHGLAFMTASEKGVYFADQIAALEEIRAAELIRRDEALIEIQNIRNPIYAADPDRVANLAQRDLYNSGLPPDETTGFTGGRMYFYNQYTALDASRTTTEEQDSICQDTELIPDPECSQFEECPMIEIDVGDPYDCTIDVPVTREFTEEELTEYNELVQQFQEADTTKNEFADLANRTHTALQNGDIASLVSVTGFDETTLTDLSQEYQQQYSEYNSANSAQYQAYQSLGPLREDSTVPLYDDMVFLNVVSNPGFDPDLPVDGDLNPLYITLPLQDEANKLSTIQRGQEKLAAIQDQFETEPYQKTVLFHTLIEGAKLVDEGDQDEQTLLRFISDGSDNMAGFENASNMIATIDDRYAHLTIPQALRDQVQDDPDSITREALFGAIMADNYAFMDIDIVDVSDNPTLQAISLATGGQYVQVANAAGLSGPGGLDPSCEIVADTVPPLSPIEIALNGYLDQREIIYNAFLDTLYATDPADISLGFRTITTPDGSNRYTYDFNNDVLNDALVDVYNYLYTTENVAIKEEAQDSGLDLPGLPLVNDVNAYL